MSRKHQVKPISFRLYPEGSFLYCEVNIWPNKKSMLAHTRLGGTKYEACCGGRVAYKIRDDGLTRKTGLFAEANFNRHAIGVEIVSHELTHASFAFADRRKLDLSQTIDKYYEAGGQFDSLEVDCVEERFCYALGQMVGQFTQKCYDFKLYS